MPLVEGVVNFEAVSDRDEDILLSESIFGVLKRCAGCWRSTELSREIDLVSPSVEFFLKAGNDRSGKSFFPVPVVSVA